GRRSRRRPTPQAAAWDGAHSITRGAREAATQRKPGTTHQSSRLGTSSNRRPVLEVCGSCHIDDNKPRSPHGGGRRTACSSTSSSVTPFIFINIVERQL